MNLTYRRKTLVEVDLAIWAQVRHFATLEKLSVNEALDLLLMKALDKCGYRIQKDAFRKSLANQQLVKGLTR
jgi:hypothetical protein